MVTLKSIQEKIAKLQAQAAEVAKKESSAVFEKIGDLMKKHGLTTEDIAAHFRSSTAAHSAKASTKLTAHVGAAKYIDPKTGATWSGRGPAPAWLASAKDRTAYLIDKTSAASTDTTPAKKSTKTAVKTSAKTAIKKATATKAAVKEAAVKNAAVKKVAAKKAAAKKAAPVAKKAAAKKVAVKRAPAKKVASKTAPTPTTTTALDASGATEATSA